MKRIPLSQGKYALIDDEDFELVSSCYWIYDSGGCGYARGRPRVGRYGLRRGVRRSTRKHIRMHRLIMNPASHLEVDHVNGDGLDNRRQNLRLVTRHQQMQNMKRQQRSKSPYKCVRKTTYNRWEAYIRINGMRKHLGYFGSAEEAALAYDEAAIQAFGEYARLNLSKGVMAE